MGTNYTDMDFIGFSFGGIHSNTLKIYRTSNSGRYNLPLNAQFKDSTISIPQGEGSLFFQSGFSIKTYTVDGHDIQITPNISIIPSTYTLGITGEYDRIIKYSKNYIDNPEML